MGKSKPRRDVPGCQGSGTSPERLEARESGTVQLVARGALQPHGELLSTWPGPRIPRRESSVNTCEGGTGVILGLTEALGHVSAMIETQPTRVWAAIMQNLQLRVVLTTRRTPNVFTDGEVPFATWSDGRVTARAVAVVHPGQRASRGGPRCSRWQLTQPLRPRDLLVVCAGPGGSSGTSMSAAWLSP